MSEDPVCIFVDGGNLFHSCRDLGIKIDYNKLKNILSENRSLLRAHYYGADDGTEPQRRFFDALRYYGWEVRTLPLRRYGDGIPFEKGVDVMLVTDMLVGAHRNVYDTAILCSGDKDYVYPVRMLKDLGKRVEIASFEHSLAKELRLVADHFISLTENLDRIKRG